MISGWMRKLRGGLTGRLTGKSSRSPFVELGAGRARFTSRLGLPCLRMRTAVAGVFLFVLAMMLSVSAKTAWSNMAANAQIINQARFSYNDGAKTTTISSSVTVTVNLVPAKPSVAILSGDLTAQYTSTDTPVLNNTFTVTATSNGPDTYTLAGNITAHNNDGGSGVFASLGTISPASPITLGATTVLSIDGTKKILTVPSDGNNDGKINGITSSSILFIDGEEHTIASISDSASGTSTITLNTPMSATVNAGDLVAERKTITVPVKPGTILNSGQSITVTKTLTVTSQNGSGPASTPVAITDTFTSGLVSFTKYVRNVTTSSAGTGMVTYNSVNYYSGGVMVKPGDILEYVLVAGSIGTGYVSSSVITDVLPTSYVSLKTGEYSGGTDITYINEAGSPSYLMATGDSDAATYASPTLTVNVGTGATNSAGGTIASGKTVRVLYQVTVNNAAQADKIVNGASLSSPDITSPATSAVTVTGVIRTPSHIDFLTYAPLLPTGTVTVNVSTTAYRQGSSSGPFMNLPAPVPLGTSTPIDLSQPVPLIISTQTHAGEPIFVRLTDLDQNLNPLVAETVYVTIRDTNNGDVEILRLTETGPNTGVFVGYLPSSSGSVIPYNGTLTVNTGDKLSADYVDIADSLDTSTTTELVDPYGIVFDSSTGSPVKDAQITIKTSTGGAVTVYADDGVTPVSSTVTSDASGFYRFPFIPPSSTVQYILEVTPPAGYSYPSSVPTPTIQSLPGAPFTIVPGSRHDQFPINPGPALRIDIPLDPAPAALWLQKIAGKDLVGQGDFVPYQLTVTNTGKLVAAGGVSVTDTMPIGFRLRKGSVKVNGIPAADPAISADGRTLTFNIGDLQAGSSVIISYVTEVTAGARLGDAINSAIASAHTGGKSNIAHATVKIKDDFMRTRSILMGRITTGPCNEETGEGPDGVEGVRVYLEDGSFVISDKRGLFHFEGVRAGLHVVQMDVDSLPEGYEPFACTENSRFAGRAFSQFVETQGGALWRTDFHVRKKPSAEKPIVLKPLKGEIVLQLANTTEGKNIAYRVDMRGSTLPVGAARLNVILPEGVFYEPGSSMMDGVAIADPLITENSRLAFKLNDLPAGWHHDITFRGTPSGDRKAGELVTQAYLTSDAEDKAKVLTPPAETIVQLERNVEKVQIPEIILRPHFPVRGAELNADDSKKLDELANSLSGLQIEKIQVTGHTDNMRIAPEHRNEFADNQALSMARAKSVGHYLMTRLKLSPEKLFIEGKGSDAPIADNSTKEGKALNRRVELRISASRVVDHSRLSVVKELSGEKRSETTATKDVQGAAITQPVSTKREALGTVNFVSPDADQEVQNTDKTPPRSESAGASAAATGAPSSATAPVASDSKVPSVPADSTKEKPEFKIKDPNGILAPGDKDILIYNVSSVRVCLDSQLTPRLLVDNKEVPANRIGFTMKDEKAGKTIYSYIGVDFGKAGDHVVQFQGVDPFGNTRFNQKISVKRSGEIVSIRLKSVESNVADGITPVKVRLELYDANDNLIPAAAELEIREGTLSPLKQPDIFAEPPAAGSRPHVQISKEGIVLFQPVSQSGPYRVVLGYKNVMVEAETYVQPKMREWILVGLAEGTVGYNTVSGNMENLQNAGVDDKLYKDNRLALFAKGQIKGKWLLTMAYDSAKTKGVDTSGLFQTINPETYYTLYGDASQQQYDAASAKNLYIKIEREQFYALFGDYDTGMTVTEFSRYSQIGRASCRERV